MHTCGLLWLLNWCLRTAQSEFMPYLVDQSRSNCTNVLCAPSQSHFMTNLDPKRQNKYFYANNVLHINYLNKISSQFLQNISVLSILRTTQPGISYLNHVLNKKKARETYSFLLFSHKAVPLTCFYLKPFNSSLV